jgi:hypothetical protein
MDPSLGSALWKARWQQCNSTTSFDRSADHRNRSWTDRGREPKCVRALLGGCRVFYELKKRPWSKLCSCPLCTMFRSGKYCPSSVVSRLWSFQQIWLCFVGGRILPKSPSELSIILNWILFMFQRLRDFLQNGYMLVVRGIDEAVSIRAFVLDGVAAGVLKPKQCGDDPSCKEELDRHRGRAHDTILLMIGRSTSSLVVIF